MQINTTFTDGKTVKLNRRKVKFRNIKDKAYLLNMPSLYYLFDRHRNEVIGKKAQKLFFGIMCGKSNPPDIYLNGNRKLIPNQRWCSYWNDYLRPFLIFDWICYMTTGIAPYRCVTEKILNEWVLVPKQLDFLQGAIYATFDHHKTLTKDFYFEWYDSINNVEVDGFRYDPTINFLFAQDTSPTLGYIDNFDEFRNVANIFNLHGTRGKELMNPYNSPWASIIHHHFEYNQEKEVQMFTDYLKTQVDIIFGSTVPYNPDENAIFQKMVQPSGSSKDSKREAPNLNFETVHSLYNTLNTQIHQDPQSEPSGWGDAQKRKQDVLNTIMHALMYPNMTPHSVGNVKFYNPGLAFTPNYAQRYASNDISKKTQTYTSHVRSVYGMSDLASMAQRVTEETMRIQMNEERCVFNDTKEIIETHGSTVMNECISENWRLFFTVEEEGQEKETEMDKKEPKENKVGMKRKKKKSNRNKGPQRRGMDDDGEEEVEVEEEREVTDTTNRKPVDGDIPDTAYLVEQLEDMAPSDTLTLVFNPNWEIDYKMLSTVIKDELYDKSVIQKLFAKPFGLTEQDYLNTEDTQEKKVSPKKKGKRPSVQIRKQRKRKEIGDEDIDVDVDDVDDTKKKNSKI